MLSFESFQANAKDVFTLTWNHSHILHGLVRWLRPKVAVEVGTLRGGSAIWIARALQENDEGMLYCIDDFSLEGSSPAILYNHLSHCGVEDFTQILIGKSDEVVWPEKIDFAFIDGDHSYEGCLKDVNNAIRRGATCIAVHDTTAWSGPRDWLEQFCKEHSDEWGIIEVTFDEGLTIILKKPKQKIPCTWTGADLYSRVKE